ncbi:hypothetical protein IHN63_00670 [Deinococcus sp. 6YEL10]|uniref:hypothetical protein n=1 Tax=Deinococcus sp. 6YEL10 TaxID=2745870 RepID=UPI001E30C3AD|nr:hypothetical protein [Deinococcus sp. 6YEL10]MCD0159811.1 hypothetical protein [Deinococcus sp. 6YEL10]
MHPDQRRYHTRTSMFALDVATTGPDPAIHNTLKVSVMPMQVCFDDLGSDLFVRADAAFTLRFRHENYTISREMLTDPAAAHSIVSQVRAAPTSGSTSDTERFMERLQASLYAMQGHYLGRERVIPVALNVDTLAFLHRQLPELGGRLQDRDARLVAPMLSALMPETDISDDALLHAFLASRGVEARAYNSVESRAAVLALTYGMINTHHRGFRGMYTHGFDSEALIRPRPMQEAV